MDEEVVSECVSFKCPECDLVVTVGSTTDDRPMLLHPMPMCARFDAVNSGEELTDYMREARLKQFPESFS